MSRRVELRNLPLLCGAHIRRLGEIYRSELPRAEKERTFGAGLRESFHCRDCLRLRNDEHRPGRMKVKICMVGDVASGKTALIRDHVHANFDDRYTQTLGTKVSKKELRFWLRSGLLWKRCLVDLIVWDILGQQGFRELLKEAYFQGAGGILAVADVTRRKTLDDLDHWITGVYSVTGKVPLVLLGNKVELQEQAQFGAQEMAQAAKAYECAYWLTSSRGGENVERAFKFLAKQIVSSRWGQREAATPSFPGGGP